jgi:3-methyladenine DNA glycosylase AlkD
MELAEVQKLFDSPFHEARLCAAIILNLQFKAAKSLQDRKKIFEFYLKQVKAERINNWDIVDVSAPWMGVYLTEVEDPMPLLIKLSKSKSLTRFDHPYLWLDSSRRSRANYHHFASTA